MSGGLKLIPKNYAFDADATDDPDYDKCLHAIWVKHNGDNLYEGTPEFYALDREYLAESRRFTKEIWPTRQSQAITDAELDIGDRICDEWVHQTTGETDKFIAQLEAEIKKDDEVNAAQRAEYERTKPHDLNAEPITDDHRFEHTLIVAASGGGKTTLMETQVLEFLKRPNPPGIVVIDPKGLCVGRLQRLALFDPDTGPLRDRLIIIDPSYTPALNMFGGLAVNENQLVDIYQYMFASKANAITPKMTTMFTFIVRLLSTIPNATVHDLLDICDDRARTLDESRFASKIRQLDRTAIRFFENDYFGKNSDYGSTRDQVKQRLYNILGVREIDDAFSAPQRKVDIADVLKTRKIVLVNADIDLLGEDGCQIWGRAIVGLTLAATYARGKLPKSEWHEMFVFMDEAQLFVEEEKTPRFLQLAREYRVGITHAIQDFSPLTGKIQSAMSANTGIKYASSVGGDDLSTMARYLQCDPQFIKDQRKTSTHAVFACFVRNLMKNPASIAVPWKPLDSEPQMSEAQHQKLITRNRALYSVTHEAAPALTAPHAVGAHLHRTEQRPVAEANNPIVSETIRDPSKPQPWKRT